MNNPDSDGDGLLNGEEILLHDPDPLEPDYWRNSVCPKNDETGHLHQGRNRYRLIAIKGLRESSSVFMLYQAAFICILGLINLEI